MSEDKYCQWICMPDLFESFPIKRKFKSAYRDPS